jgi:predicted ATPase
MRAALAWHDSILRGAIEAHGGYVFATGGDGFAAAFGRAGDALAAAEKARTSLTNEEWPAGAPIRVRMALHTGEASERDGNYFGGAVNRAARLMAIGHGHQLLASAATAEVLAEADLVDLGEHRLRDLDRPMHVFQVGAGQFPPLRSLDAFPGNLPAQVSSFIGRSRELERTAAALAESRVVTLTGVGGVGKTRLALQVAAEVLPRFSDGAWLAELAPVRDPSSVPDAVAAVFDVVPRGGQTVAHAVVEFLRGKQLLLIVDNCEHLLDPTAKLIESVERSCPRVAVLATSREGLGIDGERMLAVPSLGSPEVDDPLEVIAEAAAVRLFVERAQAAKAEFGLTPANASAVAQVCRRLDGMPLAIELAAARVPAMSPAELASRLERRFEVLAGGRRGAVERHQTLRAAIDWSYEMLSDAQQRVLARLTVFAGGCTLEAAEAVCGGGPVEPASVWELLATLVARSLVVAEDFGPGTRYRLLETIRQYGEGRLDEHGETAELRRRHAEYYVALAAALEAQLLGGRHVDALERVAVEKDNMARAMASAIDTADVDLALKLLCSVPPAEGQLGFAVHIPAGPALALTGARDHPDYALALAIAAWQAANRGDLTLGEQLCREATAAAERTGAGEGLVASRVNAVRGILAMSAGAWHDAAVYMEEGTRLARALGRAGEATIGLWSSANCYAIAGDTDAAEPIAMEAYSEARRLSLPQLAALASTALATSLAGRDPDRARAYLRESIETSTALGFETAGLATAMVLAAARLGDAPLVLELAPRSIRLLHWNGNRPQLSGIVNVIAWAAAGIDPEAAARLQGAARHLALSDSAGLSTDHGPTGSATTTNSTAGLIAALRRETTAQVVDSLGDARLRELRAEGEAMDTDSAVRFALTLVDRALG